MLVVYSYSIKLKHFCLGYMRSPISSLLILSDTCIFLPVGCDFINLLSGLITGFVQFGDFCLHRSEYTHDSLVFIIHNSMMIDKGNLFEVCVK